MGPNWTSRPAQRALREDMRAERIIAMSRHESRQKLAREFGATDIVTERGDAGVARIKAMTEGLGKKPTNNSIRK